LHLTPEYSSSNLGFLSGTIPSEIGRLSKLGEFAFVCTQLPVLLLNKLTSNRCEAVSSKWDLTYKTFFWMMEQHLAKADNLLHWNRRQYCVVPGSDNDPFLSESSHVPAKVHPFESLSNNLAMDTQTRVSLATKRQIPFEYWH
jgi:hypothetical protein